MTAAVSLVVRRGAHTILTQFAYYCSLPLPRLSTAERLGCWAALLGSHSVAPARVCLFACCRLAVCRCDVVILTCSEPVGVLQTPNFRLGKMIDIGVTVTLGSKKGNEDKEALERRVFIAAPIRGRRSVSTRLESLSEMAISPSGWVENPAFCYTVWPFGCVLSKQIARSLCAVGLHVQHRTIDARAEPNLPKRDPHARLS